MATFEDMMNAPTTVHPVVVPRRRRVRGLRITAVPSWPLLAQVGGAGSTVLGTYLAWGLAATLILVGAGAVVLGALREGGKI